MSGINWDFPTLGGKVCWDTIKQKDGWKLQINKVTGHARILDPNNIRKAWGNPAEMDRYFSRMFSENRYKY